MTREQVETDQRLRLAVGMIEAMRESGYVGTSVADILGRAGVSRETFYRLHTDKADCFLAAFDLVADILIDRVERSRVDEGTRAERVRAVVSAYLELLAEEPAAARLFLVEVNAVGGEAILRRAAVQERLALGLAEVLDTDGSERALAAARIVVAAVGSLVVPLLVADDLDGLVALGPTIVEHVAELDRGGAFD